MENSSQNKPVMALGQASLMVAVRVRPLLSNEKSKQGKIDILRIMNSKIVLVLDPDESKDYLDQRANRTKEKRYTFDLAFDTKASNRDIYMGTIDHLVAGVMNGLNGTVFAYGATGSGKTHTMVGSYWDPGLMVLSLERIFRDKAEVYPLEEFNVLCSYLEVYNEVIYDLLVNNSGPLELREDPQQSIQVAGLKRVKVETVDEIMALLDEGNRRRKTDSTDANKASSRSHAVLEIMVKRTPKNQYQGKKMCGKLSLVDLAGSERAAETNNHGQKLRDGANINKSLLALANCINALGKQKKGRQYVPYRNSKLTRLLKDGLNGNSNTAMIATVAAASDQYHHSINTLKYADRAKEIKTHIVQNVGSVESHVSDYEKIIDNLQIEVQNLRSQLHNKPSPQPSSQGDDQLSWIDNLAAEINENVEERINLQKALFELEDLNVCNKFELKQLDECLIDDGLQSKKGASVRERRSNILESIRENEEAGLKYRADIEANEEGRRLIQARIDERMGEPQTASFLKILSSFRLQAVRLQELQFQMAVRDQIISEQRTALSNLWSVVEAAGFNRSSILELAHEEGIFMEGFLPASGPPTVGASDLTSVLNAEKHASNIGNNTIVGERARYRYRFWSNYDGSTPAEPEEERCWSRPHSACAIPGKSIGDNPRAGEAKDGLRKHLDRDKQQQHLPNSAPSHEISSTDSSEHPETDRPSYRLKTAPQDPSLMDNTVPEYAARPRSLDGSHKISSDRPKQANFMLSGAGIRIGSSRKELPPVTPTEVDQKIHKLRGRLEKKLADPSGQSACGSCNTPEDLPQPHAIQGRNAVSSNPYRRHSDTGAVSRSISEDERQRERRRAKLKLFKKISQSKGNSNQ